MITKELILNLFNHELEEGQVIKIKEEIIIPGLKDFRIPAGTIFYKSNGKVFYTYIKDISDINYDEIPKESKESLVA